MTNLAEIRARRSQAIPRMWRHSEPDDSTYNAFLRAEMDRNWLLYKVDELSEQLTSNLMVSESYMTDEEREEITELFGEVPEPEPLEQMLAAVEKMIARRAK